MLLTRGSAMRICGFCAPPVACAGLPNIRVEPAHARSVRAGDVIQRGSALPSSDQLSGTCGGTDCVRLRDCKPVSKKLVGHCFDDGISPARLGQH